MGEMGGVRQRSTEDARLFLTHLVQSGWAQKLQTSVVAFDIAQFFPSINHQFLLLVLRKQGAACRSHRAKRGLCPKPEIRVCDSHTSRHTHMWCLIGHAGAHSLPSPARPPPPKALVFPTLRFFTPFRGTSSPTALRCLALRKVLLGSQVQRPHEWEQPLGH
jgi:hypothetical protein